ncbi:MAG: RNA polymerase sigma factor [Phycisphaerae bacterium]|nr:RNA polymerase sigma factor [Phycisphaerae bacterium]
MKKRQAERLCRDLYPQVKSRFVARVKNEQDAEDLAQQVFAELAADDAPDNPEAYIHAMAKNILARHWGKRTKERASQRGYLGELMGSGGAAEARSSTPPQDHDPRAHYDGGFEDLLGDLPAEHAQLLRMRFLDDLSIERIARKLRCSEEAARKKLQQVIERLRKKYPSEGDSPRG